MKKYKLKQWYPTLPEDWKDRKGIVSFNTIKNGYIMEGVDGIAWIIGLYEFENKDFWELIEEKKPLFTTDDNVEMFEGDKFILVSDNFIKHEAVACNDLCREGFYKTFKHKSNADEYILYNKPLLNLLDIDETIEMYSHEFDKLIKLAKERLNHDNEWLIIE